MILRLQNEPIWTFYSQGCFEKSFKTLLKTFLSFLEGYDRKRKGGKG